MKYTILEAKNNRERLFNYLQMNGSIESEQGYEKLKIIDLPKVVSTIRAKYPKLITVTKRYVGKRTIAKYTLDNDELRILISQPNFKI